MESPGGRTDNVYKLKNGLVAAQKVDESSPDSEES